MNTTEAVINRSNLIYRLGLLTRRWQKVLDTEFRDVGLTDATWRSLLHLHLPGNGVRQKDLAASIGIEGPSLVRILDDLVGRGLIHRSEDESDRRVKRLRLTSEGQSVIVRIREILVPLEKHLLSKFSDQDIARFGEFIRALESSVNDSFQRLVR
jgi:MarR family transcriptional regulator for hemolysin